MRHTRLFSTLAVLCVFVGVTAGSACAAEPQQSTPPAPPARLKGIYGGVGGGFGNTGDGVGWAWRMMAWYRPYDFISGEIGYADVDKDNGDFDGLHVAIEPTLPVRAANLDLFAKIGGFFSDDNHVALGLGAAYNLPKGFGVRLDWDRLNVEGQGHGVDIVTLALFYHLATPPGK